MQERMRERDNGYRKDDKEYANLSDRAQDNGNKVANTFDYSQLKQLFASHNNNVLSATLASISRLLSRERIQ